MSKPITPEGRLESWKRRWSAPRQLSDAEAEAVFDRFVEGFIPGHMEKKFRQFFGTPRAKFGNRFFCDDAFYHDWDRTLATLGFAEVQHAEVAILYAQGKTLEGYRFRGEPRRSLKDLFVDDWHAAVAVIEAGDLVMYAFIEPKMRGSVVRTAS